MERSKQGHVYWGREFTDRVYVSQIDPRRRYQSISRSLRAYSERSRAADDVGVRRRLRDTNSIASAVKRGRFECRSEASNEAVTIHGDLEECMTC